MARPTRSRVPIHQGRMPNLVEQPAMRGKTMASSNRFLSATIMRTAHGKPYYVFMGAVSDGDREPPLPDALDFPDERGREVLESELKAKYPGIEIRLGGDRIYFVAKIRSSDDEVERSRFVEAWQDQVKHGNAHDFEEIIDPFHRIVRVKLTGKDRIPWWSGWLHFPVLIEDTRRAMVESGERLIKLYEPERRIDRDVIEEAYYEQVMRERLAIFERRREWWRIGRWVATTVLGGILGFWSVLQILDWFSGG